MNISAIAPRDFLSVVSAFKPGLYAHSPKSYLLSKKERTLFISVKCSCSIFVPTVASAMSISFISPLKAIGMHILLEFIGRLANGRIHLCYSYFKVSAGFASAAFSTWKKMVTAAMHTTMITGNAKSNHPRGIR